MFKYLRILVVAISSVYIVDSLTTKNILTVVVCDTWPTSFEPTWCSLRCPESCDWWWRPFSENPPFYRCSLHYRTRDRISDNNSIRNNTIRDSLTCVEEQRMVTVSIVYQT